MKYTAVLCHSAGFHAATQAPVAGETREAALAAAWQECIGSRYVARLVDERGETVWEEGRGWLEPEQSACMPGGTSGGGD